MVYNFQKERCSCSICSGYSWLKKKMTDDQLIVFFYTTHATIITAQDCPLIRSFGVGVFLVTTSWGQGRPGIL